MRLFSPLLSSLLLRVLLPVLLVSGCALAPAVDEPLSLGRPLSGHLVRGAALPARGEGYALLRPHEETYFGTHALVEMVKRAAAGVAAMHPGGAPLVVGDLSARRGGRHGRHRTHRNGRDVDIFFPMIDAAGRSLGGRPGHLLDRFGSARARPAGERLDLPRAWTLVELMLSDPETDVQWILCERGLKARLLRYGIARGADPEVLFRASWVLHQPTGASPHDDHFHVRVFCSPRERALGCYDPPPHWTWVPLKGDEPSPSADDASLLAWLADGDAS